MFGADAAGALLTAVTVGAPCRAGFALTACRVSFPARMSLPLGLYDQLLTDALRRRLEQLPDGSSTLDALSAEQATPLLAHLVAQSLGRVLDDTRARNKSDLDAQLDLVNALLVELRTCPAPVEM